MRDTVSLALSICLSSSPSPFHCLVCAGVDCSMINGATIGGNRSQNLALTVLYGLNLTLTVLYSQNFILTVLYGHNLALTVSH